MALPQQTTPTSPSDNWLGRTIRLFQGMPANQVVATPEFQALKDSLDRARAQQPDYLEVYEKLRPAVQGLREDEHRYGLRDDARQLDYTRNVVGIQGQQLSNQVRAQSDLEGARLQNDLTRMRTTAELTGDLNKGQTKNEKELIGARSDATMRPVEAYLGGEQRARDGASADLRYTTDAAMQMYDRQLAAAQRQRNSPFRLAGELVSLAAPIFEIFSDRR